MLVIIILIQCLHPVHFRASTTSSSAPSLSWLSPSFCCSQQQRQQSPEQRRLVFYFDICVVVVVHVRLICTDRHLLAMINWNYSHWLQWAAVCNHLAGLSLPFLSAHCLPLNCRGHSLSVLLDDSFSDIAAAVDLCTSCCTRSQWWWSAEHPCHHSCFLLFILALFL